MVSGLNDNGQLGLGDLINRNQETFLMNNKNIVDYQIGTSCSFYIEGKFFLFSC